MWFCIICLNGCLGADESLFCYWLLMVVLMSMSESTSGLIEGGLGGMAGWL